MKIIPELMTECLSSVASHYAAQAKAQAKHIEAAEQDVQQAVSANWESIQKEVMALYTKAYQELKQIA